MAIHPGQGQAAFISKAERVAEAALATQGLLCLRPWRSGFCAWDSTWTAELAVASCRVPVTACPPLPGSAIVSGPPNGAPAAPPNPQTHLHAHLKVDSVLCSESTAGSFDG